MRNNVSYTPMKLYKCFTMHEKRCYLCSDDGEAQKQILKLPDTIFFHLLRSSAAVRISCEVTLVWSKDANLCNKLGKCQIKTLVNSPC